MKTIDYTTIRSDGNYPKSDENINKRWWLSNKTDRSKDVLGVVRQLVQYDGIRQEQYSLSAKLYGNTQLLNVSGMKLNRTITQPRPAVKERLTYNVVQSAIDTVTAKISKNKPKPLFLTEGGNWKLQRRAKKLDKFVEGIFYENDAYYLGNQTFRDSACLGDGLVQVFPHYGRIKYERTMAAELYVDWFEAYYGNPRQIHRVKNVDRAVLIDMFPGNKNAIMRANSASMGSLASSENVADQVTVVESWHLPSGPEAGDGLHCICIEDATLDENEWTKPYFPFARMPWCPRLYGYWAQGGAEQIQNIQYEINKILFTIQRSIQLAGSFKIFSKIGNKIPKAHFTNDLALIIEYLEEPPSYVTPPIVQMELYQQLMNLKNAAFEQIGVSQLSASSQKPAGLNSGKALREYYDIETDRFTTIGQAYERFFLDLSRLTVDCARDIYATEKSYNVKFPDKKFIESIDWKDINLEEDEFYMKMFPVSSLPSDPAGKLQTVQEYAQAGFITPRTAQKLLDFPDLEQIEDLATSKEDYLHKILEKIVDADTEADDYDESQVYTPPEQFDDLTLAHELALEYYAQGKLNGLAEANLELLRKFIAQIGAVQQMGQPPMPPTPPPGAPGMQPQAQPMAPPQSDLIQNVPGAA